MCTRVCSLTRAQLDRLVIEDLLDLRDLQGWMEPMVALVLLVVMELMAILDHWGLLAPRLALAAPSSGLILMVVAILPNLIHVFV